LTKEDHENVADNSEATKEDCQIGDAQTKDESSNDLTKEDKNNHNEKINLTKKDEKEEDLTEEDHNIIDQLLDFNKFVEEYPPFKRANNAF